MVLAGATGRQGRRTRRFPSPRPYPAAARSIADPVETGSPWRTLYRAAGVAATQLAATLVLIVATRGRLGYRPPPQASTKGAPQR